VTRRLKLLNKKEAAEQQKRAREIEEEAKSSQKRINIKNRREKVKNIGRPTKKKDKPRGLPKDLKLGDCVLIKQGIGIVRYIGPIEGAKEDQIYAGVELKDGQGEGLNDGCAFGKRYFLCDYKQGVFVRNIPKVLPPEQLLLQLGKVNADLQNMSREQLKLRSEIARLDQENEDKIRKLEAEKEKAKLVEIELYNQSDLDKPILPKRLSNTSKLSEDDEKLPTIPDGEKFVQPEIDLLPTGSSLLSDKEAVDEHKELFRITSGELWSEREVLNYKLELRKELEKGQRQQALVLLDLPDFNAPDDDFVEWLTQRFKQFQKVDNKLKVPDIKDPKIKRAILVVARMLASFTQQINRSRRESYIAVTKRLVSTLDAQHAETFSSSSSVGSSEADF